jgi:aminoglycoside 3-N-acetyltransferase
MSTATRSSLAAALRTLGIEPGDLLMVHTSVRSIGPVTGGVNVVIQALFDAIGPQGTLTAYLDFEPFYDEGAAEIPVFDKRIAHAARDHGILPETLRNWPGAIRSDHPDAGVVAVGPLAEWLTADHPFQYGYGEGSPFEKIIQSGGKVLMLGAPLDTITLLHYAEHKANLPEKRVVRYTRLMPTIDGTVWIGFEEFDTSAPVSPNLPDDIFERIASAYLAQGKGKQGFIGQASSVVFDAKDLVEFAIRCLETLVS